MRIYTQPSKVFKVLGSESGIKIFLLLGRVKELCVSDIKRKINLSISATSHQLQKMESAGLVDSKRTGRTVCYIMRKNRITKELLRCAKHLSIKRSGA